MSPSLSVSWCSDVPTMILALSAVIFRTSSLASITSWSDILLPPDIFMSIPVASSIVLLSRRGHSTARWAACDAASFPDATPTPMRAVPALSKTDLTSAKSMLIIPGLVIMSDIPATPSRRISSAIKNASLMGVSSGMSSNNLVLDITMMASTFFLISAMAALAVSMRFFPSKLKGVVTIPTVKQPASFAISATTGAAPDPVPPPIPAVTKHRLASRTIDAISLRASSAAPRPTSAAPPAPNPFEPIVRIFAPLALLLPRA
mmetsp:Transcript_32717/g.37217  ORF Transcript_32717/g.37217 Transcript_32717/m.37217 type:complete len:261 (-) Transcript_32717:500-1282(-)